MNSSDRKFIVNIANNKLVQFVLYSPLLDYHQWAILKFVKEQASKIKSTENILDAGAGELRYKKYFSHCDYTSNDLCIGDKEWYFNQIDIKSSVYEIPVKSSSFNYILCTQVLEHLEFPEKAFKEFSRVLKKRGKLIVTVPLGQGEHQIPYDYYRYTKYALKGLGERNSLKLIYIKPQGGIFINMEYILWQSISVFLPFQNIAVIRYVTTLILLPVKLVSGMIFVFLDLFDREKRYTLNYNCVYVKK